MDDLPSLQDLHHEFRYSADHGDTWRVLRNRPFAGDCDDFALTSLFIVAGGSWWRVFWMVLTFQACIWWTITPAKERHIMLWVKGSGWTDNWFMEWSPEALHPRLVPFVFPLFVLSMLVKYRRSPAG